ncbi:MAG TPA: aldo/keto reductase, partial [Actinoplanes sp.]|nr:aldo/keto reductase [Actinoplanes sp.]
SRRGIVVQSWSPLERAGAVLDEPVLARSGSRYGKTPVQVILRWHVQLGLVPIPKSGNVSRLRQNLEVFDFDLSDDDLAEIAALEGSGVSGLDPRTHEEF